LRVALYVHSPDKMVEYLLIMHDLLSFILQATFKSMIIF
jgi:hypothetical protein